MKSLIWGIILVCLGAVTELGASNNPNGPAPSHVAALLLIAVGGWLSYAGWKQRELETRTLTAAYRLYQEFGRVPGDALAKQAGLSEYRARRILLSLTQKGKFSAKAEVT